ncbi:hypothetical protein LINPERPRIM_LOCUS32543, partial [Linum perenne]
WIPRPTSYAELIIPIARGPIEITGIPAVHAKCTENVRRHVSDVRLAECSHEFPVLPHSKPLTRRFLADSPAGGLDGSSLIGQFHDIHDGGGGGGVGVGGGVPVLEEPGGGAFVVPAD